MKTFDQWKAQWKQDMDDAQVDQSLLRAGEEDLDVSKFRKWMSQSEEELLLADAQGRLPY